MPSLQSSWHRTWAKLGLPAPADLHERLVAAYSEPHRHYHGLQHLEECLGHFEASMGQAQQAGEVELALWFHDAIYDLKGQDNERRSADWARQALAAAGASAQMLARVDGLIMATRHAAQPIEPDQQLLVDIDLAILGAPPTRFAQYDLQVRAEYSWVPGFVYRFKRKAVLKGFLARPSIYNTPDFVARFEGQARINLKAAVR